MRGYDKQGNGHFLVEAETRYPADLKFRYLKNNDDVKESTLLNDGSSSNFGIGMGVFDGIGYLSFYLGWICIQIKVENGGTGMKIRYCYGNNSWSEWFPL